MISRRLRGRGLWVASLWLGGCATGAVRQAHVGPLARDADAASLIVVDAAEGAGSGPTRAAVAAGATRALADAGFSPASQGAGRHLTLRLSVAVAQTPTGPQNVADQALSMTRSLAGLSGAGEAGAAAGRLELDGRLFAPDGRQVGYVRWAHEGAPEALADGAGADAARALSRLVPERRREVVERRAADERLLLTPTPLTMPPGEVVISDDELLLARIGVGLSRRVQLDLWTGGFPIPGAGAIGGAAHGLIAAGGAGVAVIGFLDIGLKVKLLDEQPLLPGLAVSYDMLDLFGLAGGGVGLVLVANGAGGAGYGVVGGVNAQFNLFTAVAAKHFGRVQVTAGTYVLDDHHYLPQSAGFQSECAAGVVEGAGATGGAIACGSGSTQLQRLPLQVQPFVGSEVVLGPHAALMAELFPERRFENSMVTTGARWLLGWSRPYGPLALDRVRVRLDLAALWFYQPATSGGSPPHGARVLPLPWLGAGFYIL